MDALVLFFIAAIASFVGSLQAGLVNTAVLAHTIQRGPEAGRRMAIGGAIPELIYAGMAFQFAALVLHRSGLDSAGIGLLVGSILTAIGLYFLFVFKPKFEGESVKIKASGVRKGFLLGLANPQLLLFWCGVKLSLSSFGVDKEGWPELLAFAIGAFLGALVLLLQLVRLGKRAVEKLKPDTLRWMFRAVGILLVVSGIVGILRTRTPPPLDTPTSQRNVRVNTTDKAGIPFSCCISTPAQGARKACGRALRLGSEGGQLAHRSRSRAEMRSAPRDQHL